MVDPVIVDQHAVVRDALPTMRAHPGDWEGNDEDFKCLYREGCLLTRGADAAGVAGFVADRLNLAPLDPHSDDGATRETIAGIRASGEVPDGSYLSEHLAVGLHRLWYRSPSVDQHPAAPALLDDLDRRGGAGAADLDYVFHTAGRACSAVEPHEVPEGTFDPFPVAARGRAGATLADGRNVLASIVDTGWIAEAAERHWWLKGVQGDPDVIADGEIKYEQGHGTFVAGCLRSTAPNADIFVESSLADAGAAFGSDIVVQLAQGLQRSPDIVVLSFTTRTREDLSPLGFDVLYESVIKNRKGLAFLCPAGNDGERTVMWPAAYPWVVSVGALSTTWQTKATFSNWGGWVDVFAPGEDLVNAYATGTYTCQEGTDKGDRREFTGMARWSGTSFSTPLVAGMIAARMSATGENGQQAAEHLLRVARSQAIGGVGPVLYPDQALAEL